MILVCWNHFQEDISSCNDHGKVIREKAKKKKELERQYIEDKEVVCDILEGMLNKVVHELNIDERKEQNAGRRDR